MSIFSSTAKLGTNNSNITENILDRYDQSTYHFKLYMIPEEEFLNGATTSTNEIIIAESGVTGQMTIDEVVIEGFVGPGKKNKNIQTNKIDISIRELAGASLIDSIIYASQTLNINNFNKCPYFLELSFRGWENGSPDTKTLSDLKFTWPIIIQGIQTEVDITGALYNISSYFLNEVSLLSEYSVLPEQISLKDCETVNDAITKLTNQLNKIETNKSLAMHSTPDTFEIQMNSTLGLYKLVDGDPTVQTTKTKESLDSEAYSKTISLNKGLTIMEAINKILAASPGYQKDSRLASTPSANNNEKVDKPKQIHKIGTTGKFGKFDTIRKDYTKQHVFVVTPYGMGTLITSPDDLTANGKNRYNNYVSKKVLVKKYNYSYTGLNDQVLNFDMKFNFLWYSKIPTQGGLATNNSSVSEAQHISDKIDKQILAKEEEATRGGNKSSASSFSFLDRFANNETTFGSETNISTLFGKNNRLANNTKFVSDYNAKPKTTINNIASFSGAPSTEEENIVKNVEQNKSAGASYVGSVLEQAFSTESGDLVNIEMEIKGDPYWIGQEYPTDEITTNEAAHGESKSSPFSHQLFFLFSVKTAQTPNVTTGIYDTGSTSFSGVYGVTKITNTFSNGLFIQTLSSVKDNLIEFKDTEH